MLFSALYDQEEFQQEDCRDDVGQNRHILEFAGEHLDYGVGDQSDTNCVTDRAGDGHGDQHQRNRYCLIHIVEVDLAKTHKHQNADINQRGRGCCCGDDGGNRCDEDTGEEQDTRCQRGQTGASARLYTGCRLDKGGNGRGTCAGAGDGADCVGDECFLHIGHVAFFVDHACARCRTDQRADGVEHINNTEGDDQRDDGEPANVQKAGEVKLEQGGFHHIADRRNKGSATQRFEGIGVQEDRLAGPVDDRGCQHADQHSALDALFR